MNGRRVPGVIKNVIAPIQAWLLSQGRCVGCGRDLDPTSGAKRKDGSKKIVCPCGRIFVLEKNGKYRRALLEEV